MKKKQNNATVEKAKKTAFMDNTTEKSKTEPIENPDSNPPAHGVVPFEAVNFIDTTGPVWAYSRFTPEDLQNYHQGTL
ncbi:MAG: hypothetical protein MUF24_09485, partial [Chitinophagaceae bacterium]|nr:hypothetical protein [Chitinophagaceae bacterium]